MNAPDLPNPARRNALTGPTAVYGTDATEEKTMTELTRTYTADQLESLGLPWDNVLARFGEDEHRWYINWQIVFRDPADDTTWAITRSEDKGDDGELDWWYCYDSRDKIEARRVESREVTVTQWVDVADETKAAKR